MSAAERKLTASRALGAAYGGGGRTDTERIDWLSKVCHRDAEHAPHIMVYADGAAVWDQYNGLTKMGEGTDLRSAIDNAMDRLPEPKVKP